MKWSKLLLVTLILTATVACTKTTEDKLVGLWKAQSVVQTLTNDYGSQVDTLSAYSNYMIEFVEGGLCGIKDRTDTTFYNWYLLGDTIIELVQGRVAQLEFFIEEIESDRLVLSQQDSYTNPTYQIPEQRDLLFTFDRIN